MLAGSVPSAMTPIYFGAAFDPALLPDGNCLLLIACFLRARKYPDCMAEGNAKKLILKKYPNRRYYDATHSRHLTLEEIRSLIQRGYDIEVVDAKTNRDITAQVLTQIILELDTPKVDSLPVPLLTRLIRMNDLLIKDFIEKYFNQALKSFLEYQRQFEEQIRRTHGLPSAIPSVAAWTKAMFQPFADAFTGGSVEPPPESSRAPQSSREKDDLREVVQDLRRQMEELKQVRSGRAGKNTGRRARKARRS